MKLDNEKMMKVLFRFCEEQDISIMSIDTRHEETDVPAHAIIDDDGDVQVLFIKQADGEFPEGERINAKDFEKIVFSEVMPILSLDGEAFDIANIGCSIMNILLVGEDRALLRIQHNVPIYVEVEK